ncbi:hypothetical protein DV965_16860 [Staphylococcus pseudintermedius]|nr:hypothetical protein DV965_16860 [Staphylococcus pseudintermedius]
MSENTGPRRLFIQAGRNTRSVDIGSPLQDFARLFSVRVQHLVEPVDHNDIVTSWSYLVRYNIYNYTSQP